MDSRWVQIDALHNARDLGGVPTDNGVTAYGVVVRGETVANLSDRGADDLVALGVRHVIDLRQADERDADGDGPLAAAYQRSDIVHELVPLAGESVSDDIMGSTRDWQVVADRYWSYLDNGGERLAQALGRTAWSTRTLYVHCAVGKDRTGIVSALLLKLAGASDDAVIDDYLLSTPRFAPVIARLAERPAYEHLRTVDWTAQMPNGTAMRGFLQRLAAQGGARSWLLHHGIDGETADLLRSRLTGTRVRALHTA